jgi:SpoVK/Ycf46/Vps4 family AAA+-type ATPase
MKETKIRLPNSIDPAILRRMPKRFAIRLPNHAQRLKILTLMLSHATLAPGFDMEDLARRTDGLSGSDLKETCRNAAMIPVRELMRENGGKGIRGMEQAKKEVSDQTSLYSFVQTYPYLPAAFSSKGFKLRPLRMWILLGAEATRCRGVMTSYENQSIDK